MYSSNPLKNSPLQHICCVESVAPLGRTSCQARHKKPTTPAFAPYQSHWSHQSYWSCRRPVPVVPAGCTGALHLRHIGAFCKGLSLFSYPAIVVLFALVSPGIAHAAKGGAAHSKVAKRSATPKAPQLLPNGKRKAISPTPRVYPPAYKIQSKDMVAFCKKLTLASKNISRGIVYAPHIVFAPSSQVLAHCSPYDYPKYRLSRVLHDFNTQLYGKQIEAAYVAPGYVKWVSDAVGYGFFAQELRKKGDFIGEYTGYVLPKSQLEMTVFSWNYPINGPEYPYSLTGTYYRHEMHFVNHGDQPNVRMQLVYAAGTWHVCYIATRTIRPGQQFLVDYGRKYWPRREKILLQ